MTHKEAYIIMSCWQREYGENFLEYFIENNSKNVIIPKLVLWMFKNKYISLYKLEKYSEKYILAKKGYEHPNYEVLIGYEDEYSVFPCGEGNENAENKALYILSEYLTLHDEWLQRLYNFAYMGENFSMVNEDDKNKIDYKIKNFQKIIEKYKDVEEENFNKISELSVDEINSEIKKGL